ncbi:IucA/IucC family C-terminal-domain containing protein [Nocardioides convexus]|uniref:IucA/IucC family C-terminal-domain containing protein n=1 Tax=Nocardioides convexus TaxID=2712224 RepID=UPI002418B2D9|nr:IucA/IucC family C-terminal-domain containing protein [Nocardioides convexus]
MHCLHAYDLAFMPHGENLLLRLRDHVPVGAYMKDIGEEVAVMGDLALPPEVERIRAAVPDDTKPLAIHTDVFDGVLRYVAAILDDDGMLAETEFWAIAREVIEAHAAAHPELAEAAARYDLLKERFRHSCLNRLQPAQHAADGRHRRPGRVADLRRHAGEPGCPGATVTVR